MKKTIALLLAVVLCLSLGACGAKSDETNKTAPDSVGGEQVVEDSFKLGEPYTVEGYCDLTLVRIATTNKVEGTMGGEIYIENKDRVRTFVDVVFDVTNTSGKAIGSENFMTAIAVSEKGTEYKGALYCVEREGMTSVHKYEDIKPDETTRFHAAIPIPASKKALDLNFTVQDTVLTYEYMVGTEVKSVGELAVGDTMTAEGIATAKFLGYEFTDKVNPTKTSGYYRYYQVESPDNTYLAMKFEIANEQDAEVDVASFLNGNVSFEGDKYDGILVIESTDGQSLNEGASIEPSGSALVYCLIEVPKAISEQAFTASVMFNAEEYAFGK